MSEPDPVLIQILDEQGEVAFAELLGACGFEREVLIELIDYGVFEPRGEGEAQWLFPRRSLALARRAARLHRGLDLDAHALALVLDLLERMDEMQRRMRELECQLPR
jgi:chaperone modulatory protein CbpM